MDKLLTQKDLAERWQVTTKTIENYRLNGIITPVKGIPAIRFTEQHILELEGVKPERFSPIHRRKLERELEVLKKENFELKNTLNNILVESSKVINFVKEGQA